MSYTIVEIGSTGIYEITPDSAAGSLGDFLNVNFTAIATAPRMFVTVGHDNADYVCTGHNSVTVTGFGLDALPLGYIPLGVPIAFPNPQGEGFGGPVSVVNCWVSGSYYVTTDPLSSNVTYNAQGFDYPTWTLYEGVTPNNELATIPANVGMNLNAATWVGVVTISGLASYATSPVSSTQRFMAGYVQGVYTFLSDVLQDKYNIYYSPISLSYNGTNWQVYDIDQTLLATGPTNPTDPTGTYTEVTVAGIVVAWVGGYHSGSSTAVNAATDHVQIQSAINEVQAAGGGTVLIKAGQYFVSKTMQITSPCVTVSGENQATQIIVSDSGSITLNSDGSDSLYGDLFYCAMNPDPQTEPGLYGLVFSDLHFYTIVNRSTGSVIRARLTHLATFRNLRFGISDSLLGEVQGYFYNGLWLDGQSVCDVDNICAACTNEALYLAGTGIGDPGYFNYGGTVHGNCQVFGIGTGIGLHSVNGGGLNISGFSVAVMEHGVYVEFPGQSSVIFIVDTFADSNSGYGFFFSNAASAQTTILTGCWASGNQIGCYITNNSNVNISGGYFHENIAGSGPTDILVDCTSIATVSGAYVTKLEVQTLNTYLFTISSGSGNVGDTYTNNGHTFTVVAVINIAGKITATGTGTPTSSGTLTKATGSGSTSIVYGAYTSQASYGNVSLVGGSLTTLANTPDSTGSNGINNTTVVTSTMILAPSIPSASGTPPGGLVAGQLWVDTAAGSHQGVLKRY